MISALFDLLLFLLKSIVGLFAIILLLGIPFVVADHFRFKRLAKQRAGLSICQFVRSFDYRRVDTKIIRAVYEGLQNWTSFGIKGFPVMAGDDIGKVYRIGDEDLDDLAKELAERTRRSWVDLEANPLYGQVTTVRELVLFLDHQPKEKMLGSCN
jgi:hypothetical protein